MEKSEQIISGWKGHSYPLGNQYIQQPFIWVTYQMSGKNKAGKMIIDTGAMSNYLVYERLSELPVEPLQDTEAWTESMFCTVRDRKTAMTFFMGDVRFHTNFYVVAPQDEVRSSDESLIGSLGMDFLIKYAFILDFEKGELRRNRSKNPYRTPPCCQFVFDIRRNLHSTLEPIINCYINGRNYNCLVDSGGLNVIHRQTLRQSGIESIDMKKSSGFSGIGYQTDAEIWKLKLTFCTYKDTKTAFTAFSVAQDFFVVDDTPELKCNDPNLISIGYDLLWRDGWIIDAWAGKIYCHNWLYNTRAQKEMEYFQEDYRKRLLTKWPARYKTKVG